MENYSLENKPLEQSSDKYAEKRRSWRQANPDKLAEYARNYYHRRVAKDPEYKKKLCEKEKENKAKRNNVVIKRSVGRPRIWEAKTEISPTI